MTDLDSIFKARRQKVYAWMKEHDIAAAVFHDSEDGRDVSVRYLTGHPNDAVLVLHSKGQAVLIPWDVNLASQKAHADRVIPYTDFERDYLTSVKAILAQFDGDFTGASSEKRLALPDVTTHVEFLKFKNEIKDWDVFCSENSVHDFVEECRAVKDEYEIQCTRKACSITDAMTDEIEKMLKSGKALTEADVALFAEGYLRQEGAERTSFDTLSAGPSRSFAIHAFPGYTGGSWGSKGLSILDYGVCYEGYASDCTITVARGPLEKEQEKLLELVQTAADECRKLYMPGKKIIDAARKADEIFAAAGKKMPHGLGHGTGLEIHEAPFISMRAAEDKVFVPGNIITLEPGLYDPELGGTRLENDVLITATSNELLTRSRIMYL
ncbi:Xaa-Pro peptidase family protein [Treponema sp.]|uniref:M24 family metallopeptidase n=1 Tax=Treponema sp. TaxID=166 RepID=UPI0025D5EC94|nr:Xaa-Pro peptidase family protein [Treponema sp.]MCR5217127.1 Xaa-Pro peptidase family protein [Treponema sp.]